MLLTMIILLLSRKGVSLLRHGRDDKVQASKWFMTVINHFPSESTGCNQGQLIIYG
jgi:hypothetical protein